MIMKKICLIIGYISSFLIYAQSAPTIEWERAYGGSDTDSSSMIIQTTDGGYIVVGYTYSTNGDVNGEPPGTANYWIVKLDEIGTIQWQKSIGGFGFQNATSIQQTTDGGYVVAGYGHSPLNPGGSFDYWIVKLNEIGTIEWEKNYGGSNNDEAYSIQQTIDGGYIIAGTSNSIDGDITENQGSSDYWIVKIDEIGTIQWQKSYGGSSWDEARVIQQTTDGGYIVAGNSNSNDGDITGNNGGYDYWIVKIDEIGTIEWEKSLGGSGVDRAMSIIQTTDGEYIVAGYSDSIDGDVTGNHGYFDYWIVKLGENGTIQWQKTLGGGGEDRAMSIIQTTDGGYVLAGETYSWDGDVTQNNGDYDFWIVKIDEFGTIRWQKTYGGSARDQAKSIQQTTDSGYIVAGNTRSYDGDVTGHHGSGDYWVVKLSEEGMATQEIQNEKITVYPNPAKDVLHFSEEVSNIKITDLSGKTAKEFSAFGKSVNVSGLAKGVYMIMATSKSGKVVSEKFIKE